MKNNQSQFIGLSPEQKIGFVLLLVFGILTIALGFLQMRNTIYNPFVIRFENDNLSAQIFADEKTKMQQTDTDNDGFSDYDEIEFYKTSAYLPDTDSDGLSDKFEVDNGKDPLCPEGSICEVEITPAEEMQAESPILEKNNPLDLLNQIGQVAGQKGTETAVPTADSGQNVDLSAIVSNPTLLRQMLLSTGQITEAQMSQIDDATLLEMVQKINLTNPAGGN